MYSEVIVIVFLHALMALGLSVALIHEIMSTQATLRIAVMALALCVVLLVVFKNAYLLPGDSDNKTARPAFSMLNPSHLALLVVLLAALALANHLGWISVFFDSGWGPIGFLAFLSLATSARALLMFRRTNE